MSIEGRGQDEGQKKGNKKQEKKTAQRNRPKSKQKWLREREGANNKVVEGEEELSRAKTGDGV